MNARPEIRLALPDSLRQKMADFRRRVWKTKSIEAVTIALFGVLVAFLVVYGLDRLWDTPAQIRGGILLAALAVCSAVPWAMYRWVWRRRRLDQLACLLRESQPMTGDQLLGIIELVDNQEEQARSLELCEAAVKQVSGDLVKSTVTFAVPAPKEKLYGSLAAVGVAAVLALTVFSPAAATNAWSRYLMPWRDTPRYTFTMLEPQADQRVVAHGETFMLEMRLKEKSVWRPQTATLRVGSQPAMESKLVDGAYRFECPPQLSLTSVAFSVGDFSQRIGIDPKLRPELTSVTAEVTLPKYLQRKEAIKKDVRGGAGTFVKGSKAKIVATASRDLASASIDGAAADLADKTLTSDWNAIEEDKTYSMKWKDDFGLAGRKPFELSLRSRDDEAPSVMCEGLVRKKVVLDSELLSFDVRGMDDFGVKNVGIEWKGFDEAITSKPAAGERILGAGSPTSEEIQLAGTFSAKSLGIEPQPIQLRVFVEDYLPGRERVYSPSYVLYVLSPEDHAIWLTDQLSKWHRHSLEVRDRELQLYEKNQQMRELTAAELDDSKTRKEIQSQAAAERTNGRRLSRLVDVGEDLAKQASRNEEFGVGHLEKWAEMLQILKDISANRMPSVADLLTDAAKAEQVAAAGQSPPKEAAPQAGQNRSPPGKPGGPSEEDDTKKPAVPSLVDAESSQQPDDPNEESSEPAPSKPGSPRFGLPVTTLAGKASDSEACPVGDKVDEAVAEQRDLLNEFEKVVDELNKVLANLEGSTLVKRLKAASRVEYKIAGRVGDSVNDAFGVSYVADNDVKALFTDLKTEQLETGQVVSHIMDDMQAYYERRRMVKFKNILDEMEKEDVLGGLRDLSEEISKKSGLTMAQCEFWSDTMDRWAEDLVDPAGGGT